MVGVNFIVYKLCVAKRNRALDSVYGQILHYLGSKINNWAVLANNWATWYKNWAVFANNWAPDQRIGRSILINWRNAQFMGSNYNNWA